MDYIKFFGHKTIWQREKIDAFSDCITIKEPDIIGLHFCDQSIVAPIENWKQAGNLFLKIDPTISRLRYLLAMWLLKKSSTTKILNL